MLRLLDYYRYSVDCLRRVLDEGADDTLLLRPFLIDEIALLLGCFYHIGSIHLVSAFSSSHR